jgi:sugar (pentulose or hexulose) kinase
LTLKSTSLVAGLDIGTSGVKATLVEVADDVAVERRSATVPYRPDMEPGREPARWLDASLEALAALELPDVPPESLGFTGQMHALVPVDEDLRALRPALLWLDYDGAGPLERFVEAHPEIDFLHRTGNIPLPDFMLAKWLYAAGLMPALSVNTYAVMGAKDYVRARLCGAESVSDPNDAAGTQLFDPFSRCWATEIFEAAGLPVAALPTVVPSTTATPPARQRSGEPIAQQSVVGTGDQAAASRAVGAWSEGTVSVSLGTSGVVAAPIVCSSLPGDWDGRFHLFPLDREGAFQLIGTVPSVGPTLRWLSRLVGASVEGLPALASRADNRGGPSFFPYLAGRGAPHADSSQHGALVGLTERTSAADIAQAVYWGIALELASIIEEAHKVGIEVQRVVCSGGAALDGYLVGTIAACLDVPCLTASTPNASSSGAALIAYDLVSPGNTATLRLRPVTPAKAPAKPAHWHDQREALLVGTPHVGAAPECSFCTALP